MLLRARDEARGGSLKATSRDINSMRAVAAYPHLTRAGQMPERAWQMADCLHARADQSSRRVHVRAGSARG